MKFQHTNHKKLMVIHNLQTLFRCLVAIVHTKDLKNIFLLVEKARYLTHRFSLTDHPWDQIRSFSAIISIHEIILSFLRVSIFLRLKINIIYAVTLVVVVVELFQFHETGSEEILNFCILYTHITQMHTKYLMWKIPNFLRKLFYIFFPISQKVSSKLGSFSAFDLLL